MRSVEIHQALHGYFEGHKLLKSSRRLSQDSQRWMLILSDLSGPNAPSALTDYLTGYPLPDGAAYILAKTWIAREMKRPGSVWTHSLIIETADLAQLRELRSLPRFFRRPTLSGSFDGYTEPLDITVDQDLYPSEDIASDVSLPTSIAQTLLRTLYAESPRPVVLEAPLTLALTNLVLALWQQQWPRLRRSFRFCTASLAPRSIDGISFDLQITPPDRLRGRTVNATILRSRDLVSELTSEDDSWVLNALQDLYEPPGRPFRAFLWRFGADIEGGRDAFRHLARIFSFTTDSTSPKAESFPKLLALIAHAFPGDGDALTLKRAIFGSDDERASFGIVKLDEPTVLRALALAQQWTGLAIPDLALRPRAESLWRTDPKTARRLLELLLSHDPNELGVTILEGLCEGLPVHAAVRILEDRPELLSMLVHRNPSIATAPDLWRRSLDEQRALLDALADSPTHVSEQTLAALKVMVASANDIIADEAITKFGAAAIDAALSRISDDASRTLSWSWRRALMSRADALLEWLQEHPTAPFHTVRLLAELLGPDSEDVHRFGAGPWLHALQDWPRPLEPSDAEFAAFLLALGFFNVGGGADDLVVASFQTVHTALENGALSYEAWSRLRPRLPGLPWWKEWDRCERLRRGLVDCFIGYVWPVKNLLLAIRDRQTLVRVLEYCELSNNGQRLLAQMREALKQAPEEFPWQDALLRRL